MPFLLRLGGELFILKDEKEELRQEADSLETARLYSSKKKQEHRRGT